MSGLLDQLPSLLLGALAGALLALAFFRGLAAELRLMLGGSEGSAAMRGVALHLARFALAGVVLYGAARQGAPALIGALVGFEAGRRWMLARMRSEKAAKPFSPCGRRVGMRGEPAEGRCKFKFASPEFAPPHPNPSPSGGEGLGGRSCQRMRRPL